MFSVVCGETFHHNDNKVTQNLLWRTRRTTAYFAMMLLSFSIMTRATMKMKQMVYLIFILVCVQVRITFPQTGQAPITFRLRPPSALTHNTGSVLKHRKWSSQGLFPNHFVLNNVLKVLFYFLVTLLITIWKSSSQYVYHSVQAQYKSVIQ